MEEVRVQSFQCLVKDRVGGSSRETKFLKEKRVRSEACYKSPIPKSGVELESEKNKENGKRKVRRSSKGGSPVRYHIAELDKFIKQELRVTRPGCVV